PISGTGRARMTTAAVARTRPGTSRTSSGASRSVERLGSHNAQGPTPARAYTSVSWGTTAAAAARSRASGAIALFNGAHAGNTAAATAADRTTLAPADYRAS